MKLVVHFAIVVFVLLSVSVDVQSQNFAQRSIAYFNVDGGSQHGIAAADFDNDGLKDIVMASANPNVFWCKNLGGNNFGPKITLFDDEIFGNCVRPIDIDNDGNMDIAAGCSFSNVVITIMGNGDGTFQPAMVLEAGLHPLDDLVIHDVDQDGLQDIVYSVYSSVDDEGFIYWSQNNGNGTFRSRRILADDIFEVNNIRFADLDGDTLNDLVLRTFWDNRMIWCRNMGEGNFSTPIDIRPARPSASGQMLVCDDMDNDGDIDVVTFDTLGSLSCFENDGAGEFLLTKIPFDNFSWGMVGHDFDYDGDIDLFGGNGGRRGATYMTNNGDGTFTEHPLTITDIGQIVDIWIDDMDGDGAADVLTASSLYNGYWLFINGEEGPSLVSSVDETYSIKIRPNPASEDLWIAASSSVIGSLEFWDYNGRLVYRQEEDRAREVRVTLNSFATGLYALVVRDEKGGLLSTHEVLVK